MSHPEHEIECHRAKKAQKAMEKAGLSLEDLLKDLEKQRERYNREHFGN